MTLQWVSGWGFSLYSDGARWGFLPLKPVYVSVVSLGGSLGSASPPPRTDPPLCRLPRAWEAKEWSPCCEGFVLKSLLERLWVDFDFVWRGFSPWTPFFAPVSFWGLPHGVLRYLAHGGCSCTFVAIGLRLRAFLTYRCLFWRLLGAKWYKMPLSSCEATKMTILSDFQSIFNPKAPKIGFLRHFWDIFSVLKWPFYPPFKNPNWKDVKISVLIAFFLL